MTILENREVVGEQSSPVRNLALLDVEIDLRNVEPVYIDLAGVDLEPVDLSVTGTFFTPDMDIDKGQGDIWEETVYIAEKAAEYDDDQLEDFDRELIDGDEFFTRPLNREDARKAGLPEVTGDFYNQSNGARHSSFDRGMFFASHRGGSEG